MDASEPAASRKKREPRMFVVLSVMLLTMIASKYLLPSGRVGQIPGPSRGDIVLTADDLPDSLAGWEKQAFFPAADPMLVANVESWWVHSWNYSKNGRNCLVTMDQAQWVAWHELSACYVANGWAQGDRHVYEVRDRLGEIWHIVTVDYQKVGVGRGLLIFSEFGSDGTPMEAQYLGQPFEPYDLEKGAVSNGQSSIKPADRWRRQEHPRVHQCQVFYSYSGDLDPVTRADLIRLHAASREVFRDRWNEHSKKSAG